MATLRYGIVPYVAILGVIAALMAKEPHLSGMVLLLGVGAVMMYVGGIRNYRVGLGFALVLLVIGYAVSDGASGYSIADIANQPYYLIAVGVMVLALLLSLVMIQIEKELPKEMRPK